jgi:phosphatidylserine/phosphatidylglycerophosphate/cardiolipin synthase-like enzyme
MNAGPLKRLPWRKDVPMCESRASLVESIPIGMEDLRRTSGVQFTEDALVRLTETTQSTLDLTAMYWALLPDPTSDDEKGFEKGDFERMGAGAGEVLYEALHNAAARGVTIRILQSPGFSTERRIREAAR